MKRFTMRNATLLAALLLATVAQAQTHKLTQVWETEATLKVPESVRYDAARKVMYVSNIDGQPWAADGKGSIGKVGLDGKVIAAEWVTGLDCPKGMVLSKDGKTLYVADIGGIVVIDVEAGKISRKIAIPEGQQLNDLAGDGQGTLYVSDSRGKKVYSVKGDKVSVELDEKVLKGPNGLLVHGGKLYVLDNHSLNEVQPDKSLKVLASGMEGGTDGLEHVKGDDFLVSVWSGAVWYVSGTNKELLFDGKATGTKTADIGWDPATRTVYVPTFAKNTVVAYKVE
ncbi:MAG: ATP/GTP-binding protein [Steroidobacteraceae bacterium]|nr:ATP/GTP-binding protein [Steroidobacteraceae bacterium]